MRRKKILLFVSMVALLLMIVCIASCGDREHIHSFSSWETTEEPSCTRQGKQTRTCSSCGFEEYSSIDMLSHTEVIDAAVAATCTTDGKTEGKHCSVCNTVLVAQTTIKASGHSVVVQPAVAVTCTTDGKTEGKYCSVCQTVLVVQTTIPSTGHRYGNGVILTPASCTANGTKKYTCSVSGCGHTYTENYEMPTFTATEIYNQSIAYVGEIVTYDQQGEGYALGTGFVISADGRVVTNYHVIDGAYSATITIGEQTYPIVSVLAYDANIDLAVLKINATNLPHANVCKKPVQAGQTVYAIGSSRGLTNTYSQGIITYADRVVDGVSHVQHDASITHGNSGGPLINVYGEVIGINTWGLDDSQNLNFAVSAKELDNLTYGTPMTLAELCELNHNPYEVLYTWLSENYTSSDDTFIRYDDYYDDDSWYSLGYNAEYETLYIDVQWIFEDDAVLYLMIAFSEEDSTAAYVAHYTSGTNENVTVGIIDSATFTENTPLTYESFEGDYWTEASLMEFYQFYTVDLLRWFDWASENYEMGAGLSDVGFTAFETSAQ